MTSKKRDDKQALLSGAEKKSTAALSCVAALAHNPEERTIDFQIHSGGETRYKDLVDMASGDIEQYKTNPVVLWSHDMNWGPSIPAVARAESIEFANGGLVSQAKFPTMDEAGEEHGKFCDSLYRLYANRFMNACSIGFQWRRYEWRSDEDYSVTFYDWTLYEWSLCNVGMEPGALQMSLKAGARSGIDVSPFATYAAKILDCMPQDDPATRAIFDQIWSAHAPQKRTQVTFNLPSGFDPDKMLKTLEALQTLSDSPLLLKLGGGEALATDQTPDEPTTPDEPVASVTDEPTTPDEPETSSDDGTSSASSDDDYWNQLDENEEIVIVE